MGNMVEFKDISAIHAIDLELLCAFDKMCRDAGLVYSLAGGTLLGAVRHKGFIPWDDDADLFMLRPDYEKFLKIYSGKILVNEHYSLVHIDNEAPGIPFARLVDNRTKVVHPRNKQLNKVWIDILPLDGIPKTKDERRFLVKRLRKLRLYRLRANAQPFTGKTRLRAILKTPVAYLMRKLGIRKFIIRKIIKESQAVPYETVERVGELVAQAKVKGTVCKETFKEYVLLDFEDKQFMAMPDYKRYLKECYGDYMKLPPLKKQRAHNIRLFVDIDAYDGELRNKLLDAHKREK